MDITKKPTVPNDLLRYQRRLKQWTLEETANELYNLCGQQIGKRGDINAKMVGRWERGEHVPSLYYQRKLCELYSKNSEELGFIDRQETFEGLGYQEMNKSRRTFIQQAIGITSVALTPGYQGLLSTEPWERLSTVLTRPSNVDAIALSDLQTITNTYWQLRTSVASSDLLHGVMGHLQTIIQLLQGSLPLAARNHLCTLAGETSQLIGQIFFDMQDTTNALAYYKVSLDAAQEATNYHLQAAGLGRISLLQMHSGRPDAALPLLQEARQLATCRATATTYSWLAAVEAEAHANIGEQDSCFQALEQAEQITNRNQEMSEEDPYRTGFNPSRLAGYKGICYVRLRQPEAAQAALNDALVLIHPLPMRRRSTILTDLATTYVQQGEIEAACTLARQAIAMTAQIKSAAVLQRIRGFRHELEPWETLSMVRELDEEITTLLARVS